MASADFLQFVVTAAFGFSYLPSARSPQIRTTTFLPCNSHIRLTLPTAERVVVLHHPVVAHVGRTIEKDRHAVPVFLGGAQSKNLRTAYFTL